MLTCSTALAPFTTRARTRVINGLLLPVLCAVSFAACSSAKIGPTDTPVVTPVTVSIAPSSVQMTVGQTQTFTVSISGGSTTSPPTLQSCNSSAPAIAAATVSGSACAATAVGSGPVSITAFVSTGQSATATVNVAALPAAITNLTVAPSAPTITVGGTVTLVPSVTRGSTAITPSYTYQSGSPSVATVNTTSGVVSAVGNGIAVITVTATGSGTGFTSTSLSTTATVTVNPLPSGITSFSVQPTSVNLAAGGTITIVPTVQQPSGAPLSVVTYVTGASAIATVNQSTGVLTAVGAGTTTITATATSVLTSTFAAASVSQTIPVTVTPAPDALTTLVVTRPTDSTSIRRTIQLTANATRASAAVTLQPYVYSSSNTSIATVSSAGLVTGAALGTATVRVSATGTGTGFTSNTLTRDIVISVVNACDRRLLVTFGTAVAGRVDADSCQGDREVFRYAVDAQSRVRITVTESNGPLFVSPLLSSGLTNAWETTLISGFGVNALVTAGTYSFSVRSTTVNNFQVRVERNPADDCASLVTMFGVTNVVLPLSQTCPSAVAGGVTYRYRAFYLMPIINASETFTVRASAPAFPARIDVYTNADISTPLSSTTAAANGAIATLAYGPIVSRLHFVEVTNRAQPNVFDNVTVSFFGPTLGNLVSGALFENLPSMTMMRSRGR